MRGVNPAPVAPFQHRVAGDADTTFEDADLIDVVLHFHGAFARCLRHRVVVAINRDHALVADTPLYRQHCAVGNGG